jgi:sporulation protein YlmC with PRC-barrel domain
MKAIGTLTAGALSASLLLTPLGWAQLEELGLEKKPAVPRSSAPPSEPAPSRSAGQETIPLSSSTPASQDIKVSGSTLIGTTVKTVQGEDLGKIKDLMIDAHSGRVTGAMLAVGGTLGMGSKVVQIPWEALKLGLGKQELVVEMEKDQLQTALHPDAAPPTRAERDEPEEGSEQN